MASNYKKEPIFLLDRTWDNNTKLPEKYKFQGTNTWNKAERTWYGVFPREDSTRVQPGRDLTQLELVQVYLGIWEHIRWRILHHLAQGPHQPIPLTPGKQAQSY